MFNNLGAPEIAVLLLLALFVFGPDRLPKAAADAGRLVRRLREMASGLTDDLKAELGPEVGDLDLASLHPRRFVQKHLFDEPDAAESSPAVSGRRNGPPLQWGEAAPYDSDAT